MELGSWTIESSVSATPLSPPPSFLYAQAINQSRSDSRIPALVFLALCLMQAKYA